MILPDQLPEYLELGFKKGMKPRQNKV